ncbi:hypothetical protein AVEN_44057-1 [Araneus ventricosus]|uniref:Uncharacterized protein n=1 Tax=Araneus ventricosus TaxID=182803 RepID=A0A4Y2HAG3_ARAVE|nr:hypothetical protein AVEN_44057-1 [Araneus ventricosus]
MNAMPDPNTSQTPKRKHLLERFMVIYYHAIINGSVSLKLPVRYNFRRPLRTSIRNSPLDIVRESPVAHHSNKHENSPLSLEGLRRRGSHFVRPLIVLSCAGHRTSKTKQQF